MSGGPAVFAQRKGGASHSCLRAAAQAVENMELMQGCAWPRVGQPAQECSERAAVKQRVPAAVADRGSGCYLESLADRK